MEFPLDEFSIAGYVAHTDTELNIPDAYQLSKDVPYSLNRSFDQKTGYRTKSILAIPLANKQKEVIGVLQFINRKKARSKCLMRNPHSLARYHSIATSMYCCKHLLARLRRDREHGTSERY